MPTMPKVARSYLAYCLALFIPLLTGAAWVEVSPAMSGAGGFVALFLVAVLGRSFGFGPTIMATATMGGVLWFRIFPFEFPSGPPSLILTRLLFFLAIGFMIAFCTLRKREAEDALRSLVALSPDGIGMIDDRGRITFANPALLRILGAADAAQLDGKTPLDFVHADFRHEAEKRIAALLTGQSLPWAEEKWERIDGGTVDVEVAAVPGHMEGRIVGQGFVRDISERKKAEGKIEESRRRLQALFDTAIDAILFVDSSGRYVDANPAASRLLGYTHEEILAMRVGDFTPPGHETSISGIWQKVKEGERLQGEFTIRRKDGETREIEYRTVADVLPGLHCAFMHDITERKEAERSVRQLSSRLLQLQDEERRRIARQLHDTTAQNLAALRLNLSRIGRWSGASDPALRETIDESVAMAEQSIAEIRTLCYLLYPPMIEEAGLLPSLRWYAHGFQERSGIKVALDFPDELERLPLDLETAMFRIVQEALTNIQRHAGSAVATIRLKRRPHALRLEIDDEGRGLPARLRDHEEMLPASGVGLVGMRERVRDLGGEMQIQSDDQGTRIVVTLPVAVTLH
jgi:two-component system, NarL family, sensor kinase